MKLSILDQAPISKNQSPSEALQNMAQSAIIADELGYHRFWIAEHHNTIGLASSAPEISLAYLAACTKNIRLGTGGTMMMHYSAYKMAEVFKTLSAYAPGRIDFGGGRAPGGDSRSIYALSEGRQAQVHNLYQKYQDTLALMLDGEGEEMYYKNLITQPQNVVLPQTFMLGSTGASAEAAGQMGSAYAYVQFFTGNIDPELFHVYKENFVPSPFLSEPLSLACYFVTVSETEEEAKYQALSADISRMLLHQGKQTKRLSPEEAHSYPLTEGEKEFIRQHQSWHLVGTAKQIAAKLKEEQARNHFDEVMICTIPYSMEQKLFTYRSLAQELIG